jgi:hypothetical protein
LSTITERWYFPSNTGADEVLAVAINPSGDGILLGKKRLVDGQWVSVPDTVVKLDAAALNALELVLSRTCENMRRVAGNNANPLRPPHPLYPTVTQEIVDAMHLKGTRVL